MIGPTDFRTDPYGDALAELQARGQPIIAAAYERRSTLDQQPRSLQLQQDLIANYAREHGIKMIEHYSDSASGLSPEGRDAFKQLILDATQPDPPFNCILVTDVTRWGRFADPDEAAYYEFLCRSNGVEVLYVDEHAVAAPLPIRGLLRALNRVLAWNYSLCLGKRIRKGVQNAIEEGHWRGGRPPLGYRRRIIHRKTGRGYTVDDGEHKYGSEHYVVLVPGLREEIELVRRVFHLYAIKGFTARKIAGILNRSNAHHRGVMSWEHAGVLRMLRGPVYIGCNKVEITQTMSGATSRRQRYGYSRVRIRRCREKAFPPLVSEQVFFLAQLRCVGSPLWAKRCSAWLREHPTGDVAPSAADRRKPHGYSNVEALEWLSRIAIECGTVTPEALARYPDAPPEEVYVKRFGSIADAARVWKVFRRRRKTPEEMLQDLRRIREERGIVNERLLRSYPEMVGMDEYRRVFGGLSHACKLIGFSPRRQVTNQMILADIRALIQKGGKVGASELDRHLGCYRSALVRKRFGSFAKAAELAKLQPSETAPADSVESRHSVPPASTPVSRRQAVAYLRRSKPQEPHAPLADQRAAIEAYADMQDYEIIRWFVDRGTGLNAKSRPHFRELIQEAQKKERDFSCVLVYDTSRWGRFQDIDEGAYYEYLLKRQGVSVIMVLEDGGAPAHKHVVRAVQRALAAEYSRRLSRATHEARKAVTRMGYWAGGLRPFAMQGVVVTADGRVVKKLAKGERKQHGGKYRLILEPGHPDEVKLVKDIFHMYVHSGIPIERIADWIRKERPPGSGRRSWWSPSVSAILRNRVYVGDLVMGKKVYHLGEKPKAARPSDWIVKKRAFKGMVPQKVFDMAQERLARSRRSVEDMLSALRRAYLKHGTITRRILCNEKDTPHPDTYARYFGSMENAYLKAGVIDLVKRDLLRLLRRFVKGREATYAKNVRRAKGIPRPETYQRFFGSVEEAFRLIGCELKSRASPKRKRALKSRTKPAKPRRWRLPTNL